MNDENAHTGATHPTVWSFDPGRASIGKAMRDVKMNDFLHETSLLWEVIPTI